MRTSRLLVLLACASCSRAASTSSSDAAPPVASVAVTPPSSTASAAPLPMPSASASASDVDADVIDFENQFDYDSDDVDASAGDPSRLTTKPGYDSYANPRFGFSLDVPKAFDAMPPPENGDGSQWRLGRLVAMTASGMNFMPELGMMCANSKNVVAHNESKSACFSTGKRDGYIYWERHVVARDVDFSLRFQYAESLKTAMDAVVTRVNKSWLH